MPGNFEFINCLLQKSTGKRRQNINKIINFNPQVFYK